MRKRIIDPQSQDDDKNNHQWLNLKDIALVEISSEDEHYPIEAALTGGSGWRASSAGEQTLRLLFDQPQRITLIDLLFIVEDQSRTQEFVLQWSADGGQSFQPVARQQYNFSSPDSTREEEQFPLDLHDVTTLEMRIIPEISGGDARASLARWRIA
ncbi:MAG: hypothetical protein R8K50_07580 [Mariprofundus sp.]